MVSERERRGASRLPLSLVLLPLLLAACFSRRAEIEDPPASGELPVTEVPRPEGGVPPVEGASLAHPEGLSCSERPRQHACAGTNDFGCDFNGWLQTLAQSCQTETDCRTDGWVEVEVGPDGCASELRMESPNQPYVTCITAALSRYSCPCSNVLGSRFLGLANDGCAD